MRQIKIAQVGVGNWGKNLLRNFYTNPQVEVKTICELDKGIREKVMREYPRVKATDEVGDILRDREIEAVVVATLPKTHYELVKECLLQGKHVFVEKPMVLKAEHGEDLVQLTEQKNRILMVGHILEYHPAFVKLKELMDSGELGEVYYIYSTRVNLGVVRDYESSMWSFAPHDISVVLMLIGNDPIRVVTTGQSYLRDGVEDVTFITLHFPDKKMAHIHVSWLDPHKIRKLTVVGSKKMAVVDDMESSEKMRIYDKGVDFAGQYLSYGESLTLRLGDIQIPYIKIEEPLKIECQHFIDCILENKQPKSDGADGLRVAKVLEAAEQSLKGGGVPVAIN
jgi:predicted dehydrogenase